MNQTQSGTHNSFKNRQLIQIVTRIFVVVGMFGAGWILIVYVWPILFYRLHLPLPIDIPSKARVNGYKIKAILCQTDSKDPLMCFDAHVILSPVDCFSSYCNSSYNCSLFRARYYTEKDALGVVEAQFPINNQSWEIFRDITWTQCSLEKVSIPRNWDSIGF
jgi:hypothetical protein